MTSARTRIVIAGSGPVGLMTAALIAHDERCGNVDVEVIDAGSRVSWSPATTDLRVYALSRASQRLFERLGIWDSIAESRLSPYRSMCVWQGNDPAGPGAVAFDAASLAEPDLGHIVEDCLLRSVLLACLSNRANVSFETPLTAFEPGARRARVETAGAGVRQADLLIGADGAQSTVRELAGIESINRDYRQRALVTHVCSVRPHRETAWQRFGELGPIALLPLADGRSSVVWSVPAAEAERLSTLDDAAFGDALEQASGSVLGALTVDASRAGFPLRLQHATRYVDRNVALVGDAAHAVHPLAGQGMNLGLLDAAALAEQLARAIAGGEYIGDRYVLERFARARRAHNTQMQLAFDGIDRLFRAGNGLAPLRSAGMLATDALPPLKRWLMTRAMGLGELPEPYPSGN